VTTVAAFDGINQPAIVVEAGFGGGAIDPAALRLGVGPGLGTGKLGGLTYNDIGADVDVISISLGGLGDTGVAEATCDLEIDNTTGNYDSENLLGAYVSGGVSLVDLDVPIRVKFVWGGIAYGWFTGVLDQIVPNDAPPKPTVSFRCIDAIGVLGRVQVAALSTPAFDGDTTGERVGRILDAAGHPTVLRQLDTGRTILGPTVFGATARVLLEQVVRTEFGLCWTDGEGRIVFYDRYKAATATRSVTVQATITDNDAMSGLERSKSRERLANDIHVLRHPIPNQPTPVGEDEAPDEPVEQVAQDAASVGVYGVVSYPETIGELHRNDAEALAMTQWLAPRFATPRQLISQVAAAPLGWNQWSELLGLRICDRIRVQRDYGPATPIDAQLLAKQMQLRVTKQPRSFELAIATDTPPPSEDANVLKLGGTVGLGTATLGW
jgi:hypothetical protein